jgi:hypothetical protein
MIFDKIFRRRWSAFWVSRGFDGYGKIETIEEDGVVISDTVWKFSPGIKFATPKDRNAGIYAFSVGDTVAYLLNQDREITSLWYIEFRNDEK